MIHPFHLTGKAVNCCLGGSAAGQYRVTSSKAGVHHPMGSTAVNCCLAGSARSQYRVTPSATAVYHPTEYWPCKLLFIFLSTFFPRRKKVAKNRRSGQNLRFSPRPQLPRDARRSPIGEWSGYRVFFVSQRRQPSPAAERLGAHTALVGRWEVGRIIPSVSSNIEAIALTFRGKLMYGEKLRVCEKLLSALSFR